MGIFDKIQSGTAAAVSVVDKTTAIGENCTIDGDITFDKTIEIYGKITGTVKIAENCTKALLVVKKSGVVVFSNFRYDAVARRPIISRNRRQPLV